MVYVVTIFEDFLSLSNQDIKILVFAYLAKRFILAYFFFFFFFFFLIWKILLVNCCSMKKKASLIALEITGLFFKEISTEGAVKSHCARQCLKLRPPTPPYFTYSLDFQVFYQLHLNSSDLQYQLRTFVISVLKSHDLASTVVLTKPTTA